MIRAFLNKDEAAARGFWALTHPYASREYHWLANALAHLREGNVACELVLTADGLEIWRHGGRDGGVE